MSGLVYQRASEWAGLPEVSEWAGLPEVSEWAGLPVGE